MSAGERRFQPVTREEFDLLVARLECLEAVVEGLFPREKVALAAEIAAILEPPAEETAAVPAGQSVVLDSEGHVVQLVVGPA